jgi:succinyl-CoA synthetase alpha subunit
VREALAGSATQLVGPNSQGVLSPGKCKVGVMSTADARAGPIGIVSRSASLTSEIVAQISAAGLGQSTTVGIGADPLHGIGFVDCLRLFLADDETEGIVLIGEIGGTEEEATAEFLRREKPAKPIVALIAGRHAPQLRRMGHAGAFTNAGRGQAQAKIEALRSAGARIAEDADRVAETMLKALRERS